MSQDVLVDHSTCYFELFTVLPVDIQLEILGLLEPLDLQSAIYSSSHIESIYLESSEYLLRASTGHMGLQIQGLVLTTLAFVRSIYTNQSPRGPTDSATMDAHLAEYLDTTSKRKIITINDEPMAVLDTLALLVRGVTALLEEYTTKTYEYASGVATCVPPLLLSHTERLRILRAIWRLKLFGVIFYDYAGRFQLRLMGSSYVFFRRLCSFEMGELFTIYNFMVQHRYHFKSTYPHQWCRPQISLDSRHRDPLACQNCLGFSRGVEYTNRIFWDKYQMVTLPYSWAGLSGSPPHPITAWEDFPESNLPNAGWDKFFEDIGHSNSIAYDFKNVVSRDGLFFWDSDRLYYLGVLS
ncbi:hypothetical protein B0J11DRAFT_87877 [Dendryphion nanum]|uniref:F-box domain-containing protein n=1 Tax=Dendryphion nanum TaxID=256645 RepID=A0A9P9IDE8_9PLEO|nr:hypothetical protein B0J11DRAFT_87877 [Dendryphion nanum]